MSDLVDVLDANDAFYRIIRSGDLAAMDALWATTRRVSCTHAGWTTLNGRRAVMRSWRLMLVQHPPPEIWPDEPKVMVLGRTAIVLNIERVGPDERMASNTFVHETTAWRMISHQAARMPAEQAY